MNRPDQRFAAIIGVVLLPILATLVMYGWAASAEDSQLAALERLVVANPEDLRVCAAYRQRIIALGQYDRAIKLLERLVARPGAGANTFMNLALARVDKVPVASPFGRIFLGRDAANALSRSIERRPTLVAHYVRGLINLYYPESVFHRTRRAIADLSRARELSAEEPVRPYHARVFVSLGDAYWKIGDLKTANAVWTDGLARFPTDEGLKVRLSTTGGALDRLISDALDPNRRVDTSLRELFPPLGEELVGRLSCPASWL